MKPFQRVAVWKIEVKAGEETWRARSRGQRSSNEPDIRVMLPIVASAVASVFMPAKSAVASVENNRAGNRI